MSEEAVREALADLGKVESVRLAGDWALAHMVYGDEDESEGTALLRCLDGDWRLLGHGGGPMDAYELYVLGAPRGLWPALLGRDDFEAPEEAPIWPELSERAVLIEELGHLQPLELTLMRHEILARHGFVFREDPLLREYFESRSWYQPRADFDMGQLSPVEARNFKLIGDLQRSLRKEF